ncbi:hypothetical protein CFC21_110856 [Triticum aestivum]|nr:hypothetical protein CFC21_110855 [Triticum aestivum]KAF7110776.1 hypothetical protein CFC21_110856 [Triticum aestivum]
MGNKMTQVLSYYHTERGLVKTRMEEGGCLRKFDSARYWCEKRQSTGAGSDVRTCMGKTARLRECMQCNEAHFRTCIRDMDKGLKHDDNALRIGWLYTTPPPEDQRWKWRWWTGMIIRP